MPSKVNIVDLRNGLRIESVRTLSVTSVIVSTVAAGGFSAYLGFKYFDGVVSVVAGLCAASLAFLVAKKTHEVELRMTQCEFVFRGRIGDKIRSRWNVCPDDVQWLEYQEDATGPETSHHPGGLYAVLKHRSVCLLPYIDEQETHRVIDRIEKRFPDLCSRWASASAFGQSFTTLRLNEPKGNMRRRDDD